VVAFGNNGEINPENLLARLQQLEQEFGRRRTGTANEPRVLDLDLIAFEGVSRSSKTLCLPHPRAHLRRFVLEPLAEILPDFTAPGWTGSVRQLLAALPPVQSIARMAPR
jgi:2-amino-4-hydroxy-6-hydroxymethyldihydropteridine diphosphokinase